MTRILIIGTGGISRAHAQAIGQCPSAQIVGAVDTDGTRVEGFVRDLASDVAAFTDAAEAIESTKPDCVALLTPAHTRLPLVRLIASAGLPVLMEKPPCHTLEAGEEILRILQASDITHSVGFMSRYNGPLNEALGLIRDEELSLINVVFEAPFADLGIAGRYPAPYNVELSGGLVGDQGIHYIDVCRYITGSEAEEIRAWGFRQRLPLTEKITSVDKAAWSMTMGNGVLVNHSHTWCASAWICRITLVTDKSDITVDMLRNKAEGTIKGEPYASSGRPGDPAFSGEWQAFLKAVETGDTSGIRSSYADALESFKTGAEVNRLIYAAG